MEVEKLLNLYDSFWFKLQILNKQRFLSNNDEDSSFSETQDPPTTPKKPESSQIQIHHNRSVSDQLSSTTSLESAFSSTSSSPQKLCAILSGKETPGLEKTTPRKSLHKTEPRKKTTEEKNKTRRKRSETKSLSDLEFEELKGFMDLGFVFSEKDKDSSLAEIIPGLHRLGVENKEEDKNEEEKEKERDFVGDENEEALISRPYLSEAWDVYDFRPKREYQNPLMNWRFPALSNEIDMKDNLRWWAHTVASTVR